MRFKTLLLTVVVATTCAGTADATSLSYTFSTCASFTCDTAINTILSFTAATAITAPADPGAPANPGDANVTDEIPLSGLLATAGSFTGATISTYHFQSQVGASLTFAGLVSTTGFDYSLNGFPVMISSVINSPTDLPLSIGIGSYNGLGLSKCVNADCSAVQGGAVPVILTVAEATTSAVPEPASWAMMICGFGAIGTVMRRRVRVVTFATV